MKSVEKQIQGIHSKTDEIKMNQIKSEQYLMDLNKTVNIICEKFDEFERDRDFVSQNQKTKIRTS